MISPGLHYVCLLILCEGVVHITIEPPLTRFRGCDYRVIGGMRMLGGVLVRGRIATEGNAAFLARTQVNPARTDLDALLAFVSFRLLQIGQAVDMDTRLGLC